MATGIHSGIRSSKTNKTAHPPKTPLSWLLELEPRFKKGLLLLLALLLLSGVALKGWQQARSPRPLFPFELSEQSQREVSLELSRFGITHQIVPGQGVVVAPEDRAQASWKLSLEGLPRLHDRPAEASGYATSGERKKLALEQLQWDLSATLRQIPQVVQARVQIARNESPFAREKHPTTASVYVETQPGQDLSGEQIRGIFHLVAFSVPDLEPGNVSLMGPQGPYVLETEPERVKSDFQKELTAETTRKVQALLERIAPGRNALVVNIEFDLSEVEIKRKDYGGPGESKVEVLRKVQRESANRTGNSDEPATALSHDGKNWEYEKIGEATKVMADESYIWTVHKMPRVKRLSCAVAFDSAYQGQSEQLTRLVKEAVGFDGARGDGMAVEFVPMPMTPPRAALPPVEPPVVSEGWLSVPSLLLGAALSLGLGLLFMFWSTRRPRVEFEPTILEYNGPANLLDLLSTRDGNETETRVNQGVEDLARSEPQQVARLIRSTWLGN
ncbi:MAG: flagellar M-ring protein FliF C-terminal domain-containing protein [Vulcanimicrobiota bacterium]